MSDTTFKRYTIFILFLIFFYSFLIFSFEISEKQSYFQKKKHHKNQNIEKQSSFDVDRPTQGRNSSNKLRVLFTSDENNVTRMLMSATFAEMVLCTLWMARRSSSGLSIG